MTYPPIICHRTKGVIKSDVARGEGGSGGCPRNLDDDGDRKLRQGREDNEKKWKIVGVLI